ncbi:MAG: alanine--tRNA ligase [Pseudomonadota bacterium]
MSGVNEIRSTFLDYFKKNGHEVVDSSPLVPRNDPTLMFTNAGMVQFKNVFTGLESRDYSRAVTSQKCVRAGGKHNDLDNVGYTARHLTFFEMLGNFSFGDYFKEQAIDLAWSLITRDFGLDREKLTVTVHATDEEAAGLWAKISGLPDTRIIRIDTDDNWWRMGDTGPNGPCTEIFYDFGPEIWGGPPGSPEEDGDRFIEIWNLVFMQFESFVDGTSKPLPKPSVDTGMGLERFAALMQGTNNLFETDLIGALVDASADATSTGTGKEHLTHHRVIADHLRTSSFLIADGVLPSNEGRGYVLRRIMRRAMRHAELLGVSEPLMWKLVPALVREMGQAFPELVRGEALITETLNLEETRFRKTLERGLKILDQESSELGAGDTFSGEVAFKLYDTYGFPLDLTQDALRVRGIDVGIDDFNASMERQRADARKAWAGSGEAATETLWYELREELGASDFLGYDTEQAEAVIVAVVKDGERADSLGEGDEGVVVCNQTPFYGESGGQIGDRGVIRTGSGDLFQVTDTQKKLGDFFVHSGRVERGSFKPGDAAELEVDHEARSGTRMHHSATHLLHEALRQTLGEHVVQKGSLVQPGRLRFDFAHQRAIGAEEMEKIEALANGIIAQNDEVVTRLMNVDEAKEQGAMALFGEKYGDEVRVVSMGRGEAGANKPWSLELCGGTHVARTGDIGLIKVVSEGAVASGVRRVEALAGAGAKAYLDEQSDRLASVADILKVTPADVPSRVAQLVEERKQLERQLADAKKQLALGGGGGTTDDAVADINGVRMIARVLQGVAPKELRAVVDEGKKSLGSGVAAIVGVSEDGKAAIAVGVTEDMTSRISAVDLVRAASEAVGGKGGGGRPDMAQAGGPDGSRADEAIAAMKAVLAAA